jgi:O-antigen ligase
MYLFGQQRVARTYGNAFYAHNFVLQMWSDVGLIGLLCFLWVLYIFFRTAAKTLEAWGANANRTVIGYLVAIIIFLSHALVDNNLQSLQLTTLFWILTGAVMGVVHGRKEPVFAGDKLRRSSLETNAKTGFLRNNSSIDPCPA